MQQGHYVNDRAIAGDHFENQILYRMCFDFPKHDDPYVTEGKMVCIGRTYAASPDRGAGKPSEEQTSLIATIAVELSKTNIDNRLDGLRFETRFSRDIVEEVIDIHLMLNTLIKRCIENSNDDVSKSVNRESFCSKYLHFHRPNAFPILDKYANDGIRSCFPRVRVGGQRGNPPSNPGYARFCQLVLKFVDEGRAGQDWTPRSIDKILLAKGNWPGGRVAG